LKGSNDIGVDVQYPWADSPRRLHKHTKRAKSFWIDNYPVANAQFKKFLDATHYKPQGNLNFLRDWQNRTHSEVADEKPVTWVALGDARAYAAWSGKRLPHEWEWQYAAQSMEGGLYPWGNEWEASAVPVPDKGRTMGGPDSVTAHPKGASPLVSWIDEHSRGGILRGSSFLDPSETRPYPVTGKNRFRRAIHPSGLSLSGVASVNHLRSGLQNPRIDSPRLRSGRE
jgi:hypothetical protein